MANINEHILKIAGGAYLGNEIDPSKTLKVKSADIDIYEVSERDNNDGTFNKIYKGKITSAVEIEQGDKVIRGTDKTKKSVKLRFAIQCLADELGEEDREFFYKTVMEKIIFFLPEIWSEYQDK